MWQNYRSHETRTTAIAGSITMDLPGAPLGPNGTINDLLDLGVLAPLLTVVKVMSSVGMTGGPLYYV